MPKHIDNVPKLTEFRPPWITEDGTEVDVDKDRLKKYIHNILTDKAKAQDARDEAVDSGKVVETERDTLKEQVDSKDPDQGKRIAKLEQERDEAKAKTAEAELRADRLEVAAEKGLTPKQAKRLQGTTKDELEKDADELLEDLGVKPGKPGDDDDDDEDDEDEVATRPKSSVTPRLTNPNDPKLGPDAEPDYDKIAAQIAGNRVL